jgi:hypothetical protein
MPSTTTTLTLFKNIINAKALITIAWKAKQFPQISAHLMMA